MVKLISDVDIDKISENDTFFVDTNVLCAVHFQSSTKWDIGKINVYATFLHELMDKNITLYVSALSLQEFYHVVENTEWKMFKQKNGNIDKKAYRKILSERKRIAKNLHMMNLQIINQYHLVEDEINREDVINFVDNYANHSYDPIDFVVVNHFSAYCKNFITDDKDFQVDKNITVYSYN